MDKISLRIESELLKRLVRDAKESHAPISWVIRRILRQYYLERVMK